MKQHLREVEEAQRAQHADALLGQLFEWGAAARQLHALIRLPFTVVEEEVGEREGCVSRDVCMHKP